MRKAVLENLENASIIIKSAAVADYYLAEVSQQKLKKTAARLSLELDPTPDILAEIGRKEGRPAAGRFRRRNREPDGGSAPQDDFEALRHAGCQSGES